MPRVSEITVKYLQEVCSYVREECMADGGRVGIRKEFGRRRSVSLYEKMSPPHGQLLGR
jgi:hypothetical protein